MFDVPELSLDVVHARRRDCVHYGAFDALNFVVLEVSIIDVIVGVLVLVVLYVLNGSVELQSHICGNSAPVVVMLFLSGGL